MQACVIGNFNVDLVMGKVDLFPEWGQEVVVNQAELRCAGAAGNTALALARLGIRVSGIGVVGDDFLGNWLLSELAQNGVNTKGISQLQGVRTGISVALVQREGNERAFFTYPGVLEHFSVEHVYPHLDLIEMSEVVLFCGYFLLPKLGFAGTGLLMQQVKALGKTVLFDTGWDPNGWSCETRSQIRALLRLVDVFLPNRIEAEILCDGQQDLELMAKKLLEFGPRQVIIKCGSSGAVYSDNEEVLVSPAPPVKVIDTSGAGDVFNAGFIYGMLKKWPKRSAVSFANRVAAYAVSGDLGRLSELQESDEEKGGD